MAGLAARSPQRCENTVCVQPHYLDQLFIYRTAYGSMITGLLLNPMLVIFAQGHVFAMEISSGEEFYIACDNTGTPLAVFSNNGLLLKQVRMLVLLKGSSV